MAKIGEKKFFYLNEHVLNYSALVPPRMLKFCKQPHVISKMETKGPVSIAELLLLAISQPF